MGQYLFYFIALTALFSACNIQEQKQEKKIALSESFKEYWFQGKAEISSYELEQVRYGEIRKGKEILLFVTEDFSTVKHQKSDNPDASNDVVKVIKMNRTKSFTTGIYPYSVMNSVFTPLMLTESENTMRSTTSAQEWCGHTFTLLDLWEDEFTVQLHSYFISEGDTQYHFKRTYLEDAIYNRIRINYDELPTGDIEMVPGSIFQRFKHTTIKPYKAKATLRKIGMRHQYSVYYPDLERTLTVTFVTAFPHHIESILEEYKESGEMMTTSAVRKATILSDYWNKNSLKDTVLRKELLLD